MVLIVIDVRRAHFYSAARRKVFVELPVEACTDKSKVGRLLRSMYGCRDAGLNWEFAICLVMIAIGCMQGRASTCIYRHLEKQLRVRVHGRLRASRLHRQRQVVICETARVLVCHESRNPWTSWIPRVCAKHSSAGQDLEMDRLWHHLGGRSSTCTVHQEIVRRDQSRHLESETNSLTLK